MSYIAKLKEKNRIREDLTDLFKKNGYTMMETSYFELYDEFSGFSGRTPREKTVKVINNMGCIEILRPDITFNIVKEVAGSYDGSPMKLFYDSTVFENESNGIRERRQMGAEYIGNMSIDADLEMIELSMDILDKMDDSVLVIGHTKYLDGLLKNILEADMRKAIKEVIYNKQPQLLNELLLNIELDEEIKVKLRYLVAVKDFDLEDLSSGYMNSDMRMAVSEMTYLKKQLSGNISFDMSLLSKFEYYDGIIFKGFVKGLNKPLIRGGRYDRLSRMFEREMSAVGFALEMDGVMRSLLC